MILNIYTRYKKLLTVYDNLEITCGSLSRCVRRFVSAAPAEERDAHPCHFILEHTRRYSPVIVQKSSSAAFIDRSAC